MSAARLGGPGHVVIVGTGFAGLGMAIRLKQAGFDDFTVLEQADRVGGTWRDNTYPGAACDVQSHLYSFSFEPYPRWTRQFAPQEEILAYLEHCADKYQIRPHIRFHTAARAARFDEQRGLWTVETEGGDRIVARALVSGTGGLSRPSYPDIDGLSSFAGKTFHSARWDHAFPLENKRVGVIGTGASAIQIVPSIAPRVSEMRVFQRTPPWIMPKPDRAIAERTRERFERHPSLQLLARAGLYVRNELMATGFVVNPKINGFAQRFALQHLERQVRDPALRAKLTPRYTMGCKRVLMSNDYFAALQRENVSLVTDGIDRVEPGGVRTRDGRLHELDALVLATGFHAADAIAPFKLEGRGGRDLDQAWRDGAEAYLGTTVAGFPNLFLLVGPNTGLGHTSMVYMIESQIAYVIDALRTLRQERLKWLDVRPDAQARYNRTLQARLAKTVWSTGGCTSWYRTRDGKNTTLWPGYTFEFRLRTRRLDRDAYQLAPDDQPSSAADSIGNQPASEAAAAGLESGRGSVRTSPTASPTSPSASTPARWPPLATTRRFYLSPGPSPPSWGGESFQRETPFPTPPSP